jgi:hypothetical protein
VTGRERARPAVATRTLAPDRAQVAGTARAPATGTSHPVLALQHAAGNAAVSRMLAMQRAADNSLEHEADDVAEHVLGTPSSVARGGAPANDAETPASTAEPPTVVPLDAPDSVRAVVQSAGRPLDQATRREMEARFGRDLSVVRLHDDVAAQHSARDIGAHAYTVGPHIAFGPDRSSLASAEGRRLLAHELTHALQQSATHDDTSGVAVNAANADASAAVPVATSAAPAGAVQREPMKREELERRLAEVNAELRAGEGVRSKDAVEKLKTEKLELETQLGVAPAVQPPGAPKVAWEGGNLRGLGAESEVLKGSYPGATQLPKGFPAVDFVEGGTRTPLTGTARVAGAKGVKSTKIPLSSDSFRIEGGTLIQLKTLKNTDPSYVKPGGINKELTKGLEALASHRPGTSWSERVGDEMRRVEIGTPEKKVLHVELQVTPNALQLKELDEIKAAGKSFATLGPGEEIDVVINWPKGTTPPPMPSPPAAAVVPNAPLPSAAAAVVPHGEDAPVAKPAATAAAPKAAPGTAPDEHPPGTKAPAAVPQAEGEEHPPTAKPKTGSGVGSMMKTMAAAAALDLLNAMLKGWIADIMIEQHMDAELKRLQPEIDAMAATDVEKVFVDFDVLVIVVSHDVITQQGVEEKSGFPMVFVRGAVSSKASPAKHSPPETTDRGMTSTTSTSAHVSMLVRNVALERETANRRRDEAKLNERARALADEAKARGQVPNPPPAPVPAGPPNNALLPKAPEPQASLLPGAPPPSADQMAYAEYAKRFGASLLAEGVRMRNQGATAAEKKTFTLRVQVWRGQMRKLIRDSSDYRAKELLTNTLLEFDDRMRTLGSEIGVEGWKDE